MRCGCTHGRIASGVSEHANMYLLHIAWMTKRPNSSLLRSVVLYRKVLSENIQPPLPPMNHTTRLAHAHYRDEFTYIMDDFTFLQEIRRPEDRTTYMHRATESWTCPAILL